MRTGITAAKALLLAFIACALCSSSACSVLDDPFIDNSFIDNSFIDGSSAASDLSGAASASPVEAAGPGEDFYSMTMSESFDKYGIFGFFDGIHPLMRFDGKYYYTSGPANKDDPDDGIRILFRREYPDGDVQTPVCSDPVCTHLPSSDCPLAECYNEFLTVCFGGKLFFASRKGDLYVYDPESNKSRMIMSGCEDIRFIRCCENLYVIFSREDGEFNFVYPVYKVYADGRTELLGEVSDMSSLGRLVYKDRFFIGARIEKTGNVCKVFVYKLDLLTNEVATVFEREFSAGPQVDAARTSAAVIPHMIYGSKLLARCNYDEPGVTKSEFWIVDLETGEEKLLTSAENDLYVTFKCPYSEKCVCWTLPRSDASESLIIHIYYPDAEKTETYDLSKMAESIGEVIPLDNYIFSLDKGAVQMYERHYYDERQGDIPFYSVKSFEFDLKSGRAFKYIYPDS